MRPPFLQLIATPCDYIQTRLNVTWWIRAKCQVRLGFLDSLSLSLNKYTQFLILTRVYAYFGERAYFKIGALSSNLYRRGNHLLTYFDSKSSFVHMSRLQESSKSDHNWQADFDKLPDSGSCSHDFLLLFPTVNNTFVIPKVQNSVQTGIKTTFELQHERLQMHLTVCSQNVFVRYFKVSANIFFNVFQH